MFRKKKWEITLSKDGEIFDQSKFDSLEQCIRWAEQLRFEDHYLISIYEPGSKEIYMQYIYDRNVDNYEYTQNLFCKFHA